MLIETPFPLFHLPRPSGQFAIGTLTYHWVDAARPEVFTGDMEGWNPSDIDETQATMRAVYESLPGDGYLVLVPGMFHANFSDAPLYSPLMSRLGITGPIDPQRALSIIDAFSLAFFDRHLKGLPAPLLQRPAERYPEVRFETRRP